MDISAYITELELQPRTYNALRRNGIATIELLLMQRVQEIINLRRFGEACFNDMVECLIRAELLPEDTYRWREIPWRMSESRMEVITLLHLNPRHIPRKELVHDNQR